MHLELKSSRGFVVVTPIGAAIAPVQKKGHSMKKWVAWTPTPAVIGLGALLVYIVACTSFSPDDSKVLYPTLDAKGLTAVGMYDRKSRKSEVVFQPLTQDVANLMPKSALLRPQWLDDHSFLTAWQVGGGDNDKNLNLAVLPFDKRGAARAFFLPDLGKDASRFYYWPIPIVGQTAFLNGDSNTVIRLNITTGEMNRITNDQDLIVLPSPKNDRLFYMTDPDTAKESMECGALNPETFARTPIFKIPGGKISVMSIALSRDAKHFAYQIENENPPLIHLLNSDQSTKTLPLSSLGEKVEVNTREFSPKGDILYGAFKKTSDDGSNTTYGFVEIPLDGSAIKTTPLIQNTSGGDKDMFASFQPDISHDGKTLAVDSAWLACGDHPIKPEDCALFLVDLTSPQRKVTRIPIPVPPKGSPSPFGK